MPFDGTPTKLAPTLENLAKLLRDRSSWPEGFEFDFSSCHTCAMGLAFKYWGWDDEPTSLLGFPADPNTYTISIKFGISLDDAVILFISGTEKYDDRLNPEIVASCIETYLANKTL